MKLTFAFLFLCCMHVSAGVKSQTRITIKLDGVDLKQALAAIEQKSSYRFLYNEALVRTEEKVTLNAYNEEVTSVLDKILNGRPISYQLLDNYLVVLKNSATAGVQAPPDITITGRVTGPNGEPMANVSVSIRGSTTGTTTNAQGNFTISVPDENAVLVFSYVGYTPQEISVRGRTAIEVQLAAADRSLDQVVVVGYGTARRRDLTGSVATVSGAEIAKQPVLTPTQAIQGRVAGVQVITSGAPNALPTVRIRGTGTTLGGQDPLYVVDGVITEDIRNINNSDITSMEILKDASATAIYGMRAANGVLIITTKKGRPGKMIVSYDAIVGVREATNLVDMAGPNQYAGYLNEASVYYGTGDTLVPASRLTGNQTDWFDAILRRGFMQNHNVSISGGSERINYFLSAGYMSEEGIVLTNKFNRFTLRSNNEYKFTNKLKLSTLVSYSRADLNDVDYGAFNNAYRAAPYVPAKVNGKYGNTSAAGNVANPVLNLEKRYNNGIGNRLQGTFGLEFKPISWITYRSSLGIDLDFYKNVEYLYKFFSDTETFIEGGGNQQRGNSRLNITDNNANKWVWDNTVQLVKSFGEHSFNVLAGVTAEQYKFRSHTGGRFDVPENKDQWFLNAGSLTGASSNETADKWTRNSYLGRINYNFKDRYYLTATMRADGTSRFSEDNRWGYFPSIGAGWLITGEDFMGKQEIFDVLKLRGSWGRVGNDKIPTSLYYSLAKLNVPYYFNGQEYLGISFPDVNDKSIKWEVRGRCPSPAPPALDIDSSGPRKRSLAVYVGAEADALARRSPVNWSRGAAGLSAPALDLVGHVSVGKGEDLEAARVGDDRPFPVHEPVQPAEPLDSLLPRLEEEVKRVAEDHLEAGVGDLGRGQRSDHAGRRQRDERRRADRSMRGMPGAGPGIAVARLDLEAQPLGVGSHARQRTRRAVPGRHATGTSIGAMQPGSSATWPQIAAADAERFLLGSGTEADPIYASTGRAERCCWTRCSLACNGESNPARHWPRSAAGPGA